MVNAEVLQERAAALVDAKHPSVDARVRLMAATPPGRWTEDMIAAAAETLSHLPPPAPAPAGSVPAGWVQPPLVDKEPASRPTAPPTQSRWNTPAVTPPATPKAAEGPMPAGWTANPPPTPGWAPKPNAAPPPTTPTSESPPAGWASSPHPTPPPAADKAPLVFDGTIDGLRGVPLSELACVGSKLVERFTAAGIGSVYDLLTHVPLRYIDRTTVTAIQDLAEGVEVTFIGTITAISTRTGKNQNQKIVQIDVSDGTGTVECSFFNSVWRARAYNHGDEVIVQGRISVYTNPRSGRRVLQCASPLLDRTGQKTARVLPIYPQMPKAELTTWQIHRAAQEAVTRIANLSDPIAPLTRTPMMGRHQAYRQVHLPDDTDSYGPAKDRLAYDELLRMQLALGMHRAAQEAKQGVVNSASGPLTNTLVAGLPFDLTGAQTRALAVIGDDMAKPRPMFRLLQGDVGSGKSLVAGWTLLAAVQAGHQGVLMAPTEILATQLHADLSRWCAGLRHQNRDVRVELLTNRTRGRKQMLAAMAAGEVDILVGTHAVLYDQVQFHSLGVAVVDEQHRFGVEQRALILTKGAGGTVPDLLVMTATPIPRTAAMTVFGDLDLVVLDELPPGRTPIHTNWWPDTPDNLNPDDPVWSRVRKAVSLGRQGYVVCPLVEESETKAAAAAETTLAALQAGALHGLRLGLVHGKLPGDEKTAVMEAFAAGDLDVLVATTVIEVGVNVPNAAIIVILEPKQFGIAQLHQLRGRVGRGQHASVCILAGPAPSDSTAKRLEAVVSTTNGFVLSDADLTIRGPGAIPGSRQHGLSDLHVANLATDQQLLAQARDDARRILDTDPTLARYPVLRHEVHTALGDDAEKYLTAS